MPSLRSYVHRAIFIVEQLLPKQHTQNQTYIDTIGCQFECVNWRHNMCKVYVNLVFFSDLERKLLFFIGYKTSRLQFCIFKIIILVVRYFRANIK